MNKRFTFESIWQLDQPRQNQRTREMATQTDSEPERNVRDEEIQCDIEKPWIKTVYKFIVRQEHAKTYYTA